MNKVTLLTSAHKQKQHDQTSTYTHHLPNMTLPQAAPTEMSVDLSKPRVVLAPNSLISSSSSSAIDATSGQLSEDDVSVSETESEISIRSDSETYVNDIGGECVRDNDWPADRVSRIDAYRVYDSTDDEKDARRSAEAEARALLEDGDAGIYEEWATIADDQLSLEDLQAAADEVTKAMEGVSVNELVREGDETKRRRRPDIRVDNQPLVTSIESLDDDVVSGIPAVDMVDEDVNEKSIKPARRRKGHRRVETLADDDLSDIPMPWSDSYRNESFPDSDLDVPPLPLPPLPMGHRRIETEPDGHALPLPVSRPVSRGHRRIETLPDGDSLDISTQPPLKRIETLPDADGLDIPTLSGLADDLEDLRVPTLPGQPRIETIPDVDTFKDELQLDRRRGSKKEDVMEAIPTDTKVQRIESLSDGEATKCTKLAELSERVVEVTRGLADVQMITAGQAASAEECLGKTSKTSLRAEAYRLQITLDHLARLTLERAFKARDEVDGHE